MPEALSNRETSPAEGEEIRIRDVSLAQRDELIRQGLLEFRWSKLRTAFKQCMDVPLYIGLEMACGLPESMVESVVNSCEFIEDVYDLEEKCMVLNYSREVIEDVLGE